MFSIFLSYKNSNRSAVNAVQFVAIFSKMGAPSQISRRGPGISRIDLAVKVQAVTARGK
jgi:hypothetical protein